MIYVMECGPVLQGALETWVVFSLNLSTRGVTCHLASRRDDARQATAAELFGEPDAERAWQWACWCHLVGLEL